MADSKASKESHRHGQQKSQAKRKYMHNSYPSSNEVNGPGVFVTCPRGRESPSFQEIVAALGSVADELYPNTNAGAGPSGQAAGSSSIEGSGSVADSKSGPSDDIELQLQRELQELAGEEVAAGTRGVKRKTMDAKDELDEDAGESASSDEDEPRVKQAKSSHVSGDETKGKKGRRKKKKAGLQGIDSRFSHGDLETGSSFFVACKGGIDPVKLVHKYLSDVAKTGISRTRMTQRLVPINRICKSELPSLIELVQKVVEEHFPAIAKDIGKDKDGDNALTYRIEYRERRTSRLKKIDVLNAAATMAPGWKVALEGPDVVLAIEAYKMNVGVGVLRDYEKLKKYNVEAITKAFLERAAAAKDGKPTSADDASMITPASVKLWQGNQPEEGAYDFGREVELEDGEVKQSAQEKRAAGAPAEAADKLAIGE